MSDTPRTDATFARIQSGSESPVIDWMGFACHLELDLSAANEAIVDCHRAYDELWDELLQLREERDRLREAFDAACAFIDSHVADPDITSEMEQLREVPATSPSTRVSPHRSQHSRRHYADSGRGTG